MRFFLLISLLILIQGCYKEIVTEDLEIPESKDFLSINKIKGILDSDDNLIMFTIGSDTLHSFQPLIQFNPYTSMTFQDQLLKNDQHNELGEIIVNKEYELIGILEEQIDTFQMVFTTLPLIHFTTDEVIVNEPKVGADFYIQYCPAESNDPIVLSFSSPAGIEFRGASAIKYLKKSYGFELRKDETNEDFSTSLLGMRTCSDWMLDGMYIDDLRMRNKLSFELWEKLYYYNSAYKTNPFPGIHNEFVELFINNNYEGLYALGEKMDEHLLQFSDKQYMHGGVIYKAISWWHGATRFGVYFEEPPNDFFWDGWELIYPSRDTAWLPLKDLRKLVVYGSDSYFEDNIESHIDLDIALNYFLFINMILSYDNTGKNIFMARYDTQTPLFQIPWDLEASWGLTYTREKTSERGFLGNHLYNKLIETNTKSFSTAYKELWYEYRESIFSEEALLKPIEEYYTLLKSSGAIERERNRWTEYPVDIDAEYEFIITWIKARLAFLDVYLAEEASQ